MPDGAETPEARDPLEAPPPPPALVPYSSTGDDGSPEYSVRTTLPVVPLGLPGAVTVKVAALTPEHADNANHAWKAATWSEGECS